MIDKINISLYEIIHLISDITKTLKYKCEISLSKDTHIKHKNKYFKIKQHALKRSHFTEYFRKRLDFISKNIDNNNFPKL